MQPTRSLAALTLGLPFAIAAAPIAAHAQGSSHYWVGLGVGGGAVIPTGNGTSTIQSGWQGQGYVVINLGILPSLRFNLGYQRFNFKDEVLNSLGIPSATSAYNNVLNAGAGIKLDLLHTPIRPYLTAGVGVFNFKTVVDTGQASTSNTGSVTGASSTKFGIDGGAGLALEIGRFEAFAEGKVQNVFTDHGFLTSAKQITAVPVSVGLLVHVF
jgi:hypothetical protein